MSIKVEMHDALSKLEVRLRELSNENQTIKKDFRSLRDSHEALKVRCDETSETFKAFSKLLEKLRKIFIA